MIMTRDEFLELLTRKMLGNLTASQEQQFQASCQTNPEYLQLATELLKPVKNTANQSETQLAKVWAKIADTSTPAVTIKQTLFPIWLKAVAIVLVSITVILSIYLKPSAQQGSQNLSLLAKSERVYKTLDDGTKVYLNHHSQLSYNSAFGKAKRAITLQGEAFFDVAKNAAVPLQISVGDIKITVKGTAFNVIEHNGKVAVALLRGYISVRNGAGTVINLLPGKQLTAEGSTFRVDLLDTTKKKQVTLWTRDSLVFKKEKLVNLAVLLETKYKVKIIIKTEQLKFKKFSGVVKKEQLGEALEALKLSYPFSYVIKDTTVVIE